MPTFDPTGTERLFWEALALIVMACVFAPLVRRLGLGTILGYLAAGLAAQVTLSLSVSEHPEELLHFAEFGVVLFLFVIGLELQPSRLWEMRGDIFGLGAAQMAVCGIALTVPALLLGFTWQAAVITGLGLALSSTALVMQTLEERRERSTLHGRTAFSILLFQDLAIVPLLLLAQFLAPSPEEIGLRESLSQFLFAIAAIGGLILAGRFALDPMFRLLAQARMQEIMTAAALGVVIMAGLLIDLAGMSYAMGAFIAGVMLSQSNYRHEIEANIEPFRGLFLGLFFMAVGLSLDLGAVQANWPVILAAAPALMALKAVGIYAVGRLRGVDHDTGVRLAFALPQAGEFGFVLFGAAATAGILDDRTTSTLIAMVTVSMALSPIVWPLASRFLKPARPDGEPTPESDFSDAEGKVLIIGFDRFGQILSQPLFSQGIDVTILDSSPQRIDDARRFGFHIYYGDGTRREVLRAAGAKDVSLIMVCVDEVEAANKIVDLAKSEFPEAQLFVRSRDRLHSMHLMKCGVEYVVRETFESALDMGLHALQALGSTEEEARAAVADIRSRDLERLRQQVEGDIHSGMDRLHTRAVRPEPLRRPDEAPGDEAGLTAAEPAE